MSEVDLEMDPATFADLATNPEPADSNEQPTVPEPDGSKPPEVIPPETPEAPETPPVEPVVTPEVKPPTVDAPADSNEQPTELTPEEKQSKAAAQKIQEQGQEIAAKFASMVNIVRDNPDSLKSIHTSDPAQADLIAKEIWGADSFDDLMQQAKIEEMKDTDPTGAENAKKIYQLEKENAKSTKRLRESDETTFFTNKGILNNPFDPKHKTLMDAMKNVNPELVKENYPEALKMAYTLGFPARTETEIEADKKAILLAKGTGAPKSGGIPPSNQRASDTSKAPEVQNFMDMVGAK